MKRRLAMGLACLLLMVPGVAAAGSCPDILNYQHTVLRGQEQVDFCQRYAGKVLLVVNTASRCGFTPQFADLEALYQEYRGRGLEVVGFPSNDFRQEYSSAEKTARVCYVNYGVTFTMLESSPVKGGDANPFFQRLASEAGEAPRWNFHKYLLDRRGRVVASFSSSDKPTGGEIRRAVEQALSTPAR